MGEYIDFKTIKAEVSMEAVAGRYGVALRRTNGSHERGKCPLPTHPAGDDAKSFSINVTKQVWICHSTACAKGRRGKKGGDVIELVSVMESCSLRDAGLKLAEWFGVSMPDPAGGVGESSSPKTSAADIDGRPDSRYGRYSDLAEWVETRSQSDSISRLEQSAYIAVLGQIEELAKSKV